jgi:1-acyl-sn-glycerol-3-phosphate acyltransferase
MPREIHGVDELRREQWYLVVSNHRSWVDILVLQATFNRRIPFLKFFLKRELIWVPLLGLAWWALDFPFMRRHSAEYLAKHPEKRGQDLAATQLACERFREIPTSVMNFVEGTRFTPAKHAASASPYRHLLAPRAGGVSFVLSAMGGMLHSMLDVTIAYAGRTPSFWDLCCGRIGHILVDVQRWPIEPWMSGGDYSDDPAFRERFQQWLRGIWADKDARLERQQRGVAAV